MSVQAIAWVLDHSTARGSDRLVLIAIANHAGRSPQDGAWEAYPGVATIAREAGLTERTVQDVVARLVEAGHLERRVNAAPDDRIRGDRRPNLYRIVTEHARDGVSPDNTPSDGPRGAVPEHPDPVDNQGDGMSSHNTPQGPRGVVSPRNGVLCRNPTGCGDTTPEPSVNRQKNRPPSREPRGTGAPPMSGGGGEITPATNADQRQARIAEARRTRIAEACRILAGRQAEERTRGTRPVGRGWIRTVADRLAAELATEGYRILADEPELDARQLADRLDAGKALDAEAQRADVARREAATRRLRDQLRSTDADRARAAARVATTRDQLRRPTTRGADP